VKCDRAQNKEAFFREIEKLTELKTTDVAVPLLISVSSHFYESTLIITKRIVGSMLLSQYYQDGMLQMQRFTKLVSAFARLHQLGYIHQDPHFHNFLIKKSQVYFLDVGEIIKKDSHFDNLALLIAQASQVSTEIINTLLDVYEEIRGIKVPREYIYSSVNQYIIKRRSKYLKKMFRTCTKIRKLKVGSAHVLCQQDELNSEFEAQLSDIETIFKSNHSNALKQGGGTTVVRTQIAGKEYAIVDDNEFNICKRLC